MMNNSTFSGFRASYQFDEAPKRLVSMVPSYTELLADLGLGPRLVGVTDWCEEPKELVDSLPRIGGTKNPRMKAIEALKPELIIANKEENRKIDIERLEERGIPVWLTNPNSVEEVFQFIEDIIRVFPVKSEVGVRLARLQAQVTDQPEPATKVCCFIWRKPWMVVGSETYMNDVLRVCGGTNVIEEARYPKVSLEEVESLQPEVILLPDEPYRFTTKDASELAELDTPAAKNQRIHLVQGSLLSWHGFRLERALSEIAQLLRWMPQKAEQI